MGLAHQVLGFRVSLVGGWSEWLGFPAAKDASVALLAVVAMHLIPNGKGETLLRWEDAAKIPWGVLLLFTIVMGGIYLGVFTPTEAAGIGAGGAFVIALARRKLSPWFGE